MRRQHNFLADLTPEWWAAWREANSVPPATGMQKGGHHSNATKAKIVAAQRERRRRERETLAAAHPRIKPSPWSSVRRAKRDIAGLGDADRLFAAIEPDAWYATVDLATASGLKLSSCKAWAVRFWRRAYFERVENPEWKDTPPAGKGTVQPRWLYRLTQPGERRRALALALR